MFTVCIGRQILCRRCLGWCERPVLPNLPGPLAGQEVQGGQGLFDLPYFWILDLIVSINFRSWNYSFLVCIGRQILCRCCPGWYERPVLPDLPGPPRPFLFLDLIVSKNFSSWNYSFPVCIGRQTLCRRRPGWCERPVPLLSRHLENPRGQFYRNVFALLLRYWTPLP